jgi:hypothetical protein
MREQSEACFCEFISKLLIPRFPIISKGRFLLLIFATIQMRAATNAPYSNRWFILRASTAGEVAQTPYNIHSPLGADWIHLRQIVQHSSPLDATFHFLRADSSHFSSTVGQAIAI